MVVVEVVDFSLAVCHTSNAGKQTIEEYNINIYVLFI